MTPQSGAHGRRPSDRFPPIRRPPGQPSSAAPRRPGRRSRTRRPGRIPRCLRLGVGVGGRPPRPASPWRTPCRRFSWRRARWRRSCWCGLAGGGLAGGGLAGGGLAGGGLRTDRTHLALGAATMWPRVGERAQDRRLFFLAHRRIMASVAGVASDRSRHAQSRGASRAAARGITRSRRGTAARTQYSQQAPNLVFRSLDLAKDLKRSVR